MDVTLLYNGYNLQRKKMFVSSRTSLPTQPATPSTTSSTPTGPTPTVTTNSPPLPASRPALPMKRKLRGNCTISSYSST